MPYIDDTLRKILDKTDLSFEEASGVMEEIMTGQVSEVKLSSWLTALRMKGETASEIAGCASVMRKHATKINCTDPDVIDIVGTGGDGAHTINISTAAAFVTAGAGVTIAKHGNRAVSSKSGAADVLSALGLKIDISPEKMEECLNSVGIAFLFAPALHPAMKYAMPVRRELGVRTIFNILGPLTNPSGAKRMLLGVYESSLCALMAEACKELDAKHVMVVHGRDGLDEITTTSCTDVCEVKDGSINEYEICPEEFGIPLALIEDIKGGTPEENAQIVRDLLSGKLKGPKADIVILNAAAALMISGKVDNWKDAVEAARASIEDGSATKKLNAMAEFTQNAN